MALGAGEESKGGGGAENKGGGGGDEGNKVGGGGDEGNKGGGGGLAGADGQRGGLLEEGKGCSTSGRQGLLLPELHGILIPCPGASSSAGDGVARRFAPIKIDFSRKGRDCATSAAKGAPGFSKKSVAKMTAGGLGRGCAGSSAAEGTPGFSKNSVGKTAEGGLGNRVGCFRGLRILPLGFKKSSQEVVSAKIKAHGGQLASLAEYDTCTHVCLGNELSKSLMGEDWLNLTHDGEPEAPKRNQMVTSTSSKPRQKVAELNPDSRVRRELFPVSPEIDEEEVRRRHHQLFQCKEDQSDLLTFAEFARKMRRSLIVSREIPGAKRKRDNSHTSTLLELKLLCKEAYLLLKALKTAGYTLGGDFSSENFVLTERVTGKGLLFGRLQQNSLQWASTTRNTNDEKSFKRMVIGLFPKNVLPPHDIVTWLSLVGYKDKEWLLLNSWTMLEEQDARERLLFLGGKLQELYDSGHTKDYNRIVGKLDKRGYDKWQQQLEGAFGNNYLKNTLRRANPRNNLPQGYPEHAGGLLQLLHNCRHHYAKAVADKYLMIIADNFPNLLMDFQEEMYFEGFHD